MKAIRYRCDHPVYNFCTLYLQGERGLAVIQQRFNSKLKITFWTAIDDDLIELILQNEKFQEYFERKASEPTNGLYFTVTVRQIMRALKLKPLKKYSWETRW